MFEDSQAPPAPPPALDAAALQRLHELDPDGRHSVVQRVLTAFELSLVRMCTVLQAQAQAQAQTQSQAQSQAQTQAQTQATDGAEQADSAVVAGIAHTLKSSSASVGALGLAQACAEVEALLLVDPKAELLPQIEKLLAQATAALQAVRAILRA